MENELEFKYPEKYLKWSKRYDISRKIKKDEYIKINIERDKKSVIGALVFFVFFYLLIVIALLFIVYLLRHNNNYYEQKLIDKNSLINSISKKVCNDKNMTYYKVEFDKSKIYLNCNKEVFIIERNGKD